MILVHKKVTNTRDIINIEGELLSNEPLWRHTTFSVGGPADLFAIPTGEDDLRILLKEAREAELPVFILGGGSNLLVADAGIRGLVIDMRKFTEYRVEGDSPGILTLGAGQDISGAAWRSGTAGYSGLEFFFGMPGSVGGALWMNARCYEGEIAGAFAWADVMGRNGEIHRMEKDKSDWSYKVSPFQSSDDIILRAAFSVETGKKESLRAFMESKRDDREAKGHYRAPCAGSAFKNNRDFGVPSGVLIDRCGLKGLRVGGATVSDWHGNIVINDHGARAQDIRELLNKVSDKVEETTGFRIEAEIRTVGDWQN